MSNNNNGIDFSDPNCVISQSKFGVNKRFSYEIELPLSAIIVNSILLAFGLLSLLLTVIYKLLYIGNRKLYMRLRVRGVLMVQFAHAMGALLLIFSGPVVELIGIQYFNCYLVSLGYTFGGIIITGAITRRIIVYVFKTKMSRLKSETTSGMSVREIRSKRRYYHTWMRRFTRFWFIYFLAVILVVMALLHREIYFGHQCTNCDQLDALDAIAMLGFCAPYLVISIGLLWYNRREPDAFAQVPEFRLQIIFVLMVEYFGLIWTVIDYNKLSSSFTLRGQWFPVFAGIISFIIAVPYQFRLAAHEGKLVDSEGTDFISRIWIAYKRWRFTPINTHDEETESFDDKITLGAFLLEEENIKIFADYLVGEFCSELILFHQRVLEYEENYRVMNDQQKIAAALDIYGHYIDTKAPLQINIGADLREEISNTLLKKDVVPQRNLFQNSDEDVLKLLNDGPFQRFKQNQGFRRILLSKQASKKELFVMTVPAGRVSDLKLKKPSDLGSSGFSSTTTTTTTTSTSRNSAKNSFTAPIMEEDVQNDKHSV